MDQDLDESIIDQTPERKKARKLKIRRPKSRYNLTKRMETSEGNVSHLLKDLVEEFDKNITRETVLRVKNENIASNEDNNIKSQNLSLKEVCLVNPIAETVNNNHNYSKDHRIATENNQHQERNTHYCSLTEPLQKPFSKNSHKLYVFYLIEEVLKFSPNYFPKNSHIQLVGVIKFSENNKSFILRSIEQTYFTSTEIKLDLRELPVKPCPGDKISIFCLLSFEKQIPIVVVNFFQKFTLLYSPYIELMLRLRRTVPLENFEIISMKDANVLNEGLLDKETDEQEEMVNILAQRLSLDASQELFENDKLGDSTLYAFLDEISFEKL